MTSIEDSLITSPGITGRNAGGQNTVTLAHTCPNDLDPMLCLTKIKLDAHSWLF